MVKAVPRLREGRVYVELRSEESGSIVVTHLMRWPEGNGPGVNLLTKDINLAPKEEVQIDVTERLKMGIPATHEWILRLAVSYSPGEQSFGPVSYRAKLENGQFIFFDEII